MKTFAIAASVAAAALTVPAAASAQTYDFANFGNSVFSYGSGTTGASFAPFTAANTFAGGCFGQANFACATAGGQSGFPVIGVNTGATTVSFETVDLPVNTLLFHPASGGSGTDAILSFTAPTTSLYNVSGTFSRLDRTPTGGNGVAVLAIGGSTIFSGAIPAGAQGSGFSFNQTVSLVAGQTIFLGVNNAGEYTFDSTGLTGAIRAVPEPASWALMILGFGVAGYALRRRTRATVAFA